MPGFSAVYFRRTYPQLSGPDGLWDLSYRFYPGLGGRPNGSQMQWSFPNGSRIVMRHLQHAKTVLEHQSLQYAGIYFDELTHFEGSQFWYMLSRNRSTCGVAPYVRASTNPDPDSFVSALIDWWIGEDGYAIPERSGVLRWFIRAGGEIVWADTREEIVGRYPSEMPLSFTFIASSLSDNPALTRADPTYEAKLRALPLVERERLLGANWHIRPAAGLYFKRHYFRLLDEVPGRIIKSVRAWDKGATEPSAQNPDPDFTAGVKLLELGDSPIRYVVADVRLDRLGPGGVDRMMRNTAEQDGTETTVAVWVDPGQAGKVDLQHMRSVMEGFHLVPERASQSKVVYAGPASSAAEGGMIGVLRGPWNERFLGDLEQFPEGKHDDIVDAFSLAYRRLSKRIAMGGGGGHS